MPGRFLPTVVVVLALALVGAASAAAVSITFDGRVLRYREHPREGPDLAVGGGLIASTEPPYLRISLAPIPFDAPIQSVRVGSGCQNAGSGSPDPRVATVLVDCPLSSVPSDQLRYRFTLGDSLVSLEGLGNLRGVVYGRSGDDEVLDGDRVYGGPGDDGLGGMRVYGGPGDDVVGGHRTATDTNVLYGGPGNDDLYGPGSVYGGPGADHLFDADDEARATMMVGGPGRDTVWLESDDRSDLVRVRGGGVDRVNCPAHPDSDVLVIDPSDRLSAACRDARILLTERRAYPYP